ncbi:MAG: glycoside hydrolase family 2 TIM barrel-domain containing protein [Gemmatimonadaceae bacterium]
MPQIAELSRTARRLTWVLAPVLSAVLLCIRPSKVEGQAPLPATVRTRYTIDDNWRFHADGINFAEKPSTSDAGWEKVAIPHTWNATDPFDDIESYRRGIGWYRKLLTLDSTLKGKRISLYFEGANQVADVFVNGAFVGEHKGGYTAFTIDVTDHLRFDGRANENLIAVQVNNAHNPFIPPLSVGYALYGGIYRDVWLIATDPVHVKTNDHASSGVYVSTPSVSRERAEVRLRGTVVNQSTQRKQLRIVSTVLDGNGIRVADATSTLSLPAGSEATFAQSIPSVRNPHLWSPDDPYLYTVRTAVYEGSVIRDRVRSPLGFRWFSFDPKHGFSLNGQKLQLRGTTRHQDYQGLGSALPNQLHVRDLQWIKEMGANFVRLAHYPQDPAVLDAADRLGLLIWEEIPVVNYITPSDEFTGNAKSMLREMIRQHYNHPSVIVWGIMNEVFLWSKDGERIRDQTDTTYMRQVRVFARSLDSLARAEDSSRSIAMAIHGSDDYDKAGVAGVTQLLGMNVYSGWYGGVFEDFGKSLDRRHASQPNQVLFVSEYGAEDDERVNSLQPERFDFSGSWMRMFHQSYLRQIRERPWLGGTAIWNEFDFSQPETGGSIPYMNQKGMLTWDRRPKDVFFLYKANWNPEPMVHIASRSWTERTGTNVQAAFGAGVSPVRQPVEVYSNLDQVELLLDGRSLGAKKPNDVSSATWDVPFGNGDNVVEARGEKNGKPYSDRVVIHFTYRPPNLKDPSVPFHELAVNVGSKAQFADAGGLVWEGDQPYQPGKSGQPGGFGYVGGEAGMFNKDVPIKATNQTPLYFTYRSGIAAYRMDVPDGDYDVELRFAEPLGVKPGERVFGVAINGQTVVERMDLAAQDGIAQATPMAFTATVARDAGLVISFQPIKGQPILNALRVRKR